MEGLIPTQERSKIFTDYTPEMRLKAVIAEWGPLSIPAACRIAQVPLPATPECTPEIEQAIKFTFKDTKRIKQKLMGDEGQEYTGYMYNDIQTIEQVRKETQMPREVAQGAYLSLMEKRIHEYALAA